MRSASCLRSSGDRPRITSCRTACRGTSRSSPAACGGSGSRSASGSSRPGRSVAAGYSRTVGRLGALPRRRTATSGATIHQGNIGRNDDCERVVGEVIERHGRLDILVNNAGITMDRTVRKMTPEEWDHVLQVNLHGTFYMCRAVLPHMIERGYGRIVNISSVIGEIGNIGQANYAASKAGPVRADDEPGARVREQGDHGQQRRAGLHPDRDGRGGARGGAREGDRADPRAAGSARPTRSRAWSSSSSTPPRATSRATSTRSTAASRCDRATGCAAR